MEVFHVHVDQDGFDESSFTLWTINHKFVRTRLEVVRINEQILWALFTEINEILISSITHMHIRELIDFAFIMDQVSPVNQFIVKANSIQRVNPVESGVLHDAILDGLAWLYGLDEVI